MLFCLHCNPNKCVVYYSRLKHIRLLSPVNLFYSLVDFDLSYLNIPIYYFQVNNGFAAASFCCDGQTGSIGSGAADQAPWAHGHRWQNCTYILRSVITTFFAHSNIHCTTTMISWRRSHSTRSYKTRILSPCMANICIGHIGVRVVRAERPWSRHLCFCIVFSDPRHWIIYSGC